MKIELYKSAICPRCAFVNRELKKLKEKYPAIEVETIDIMTHMLKAKRAGVRTIPSLKIGNDIKGFHFPRKKTVWEFVETRTNA